MAHANKLDSFLSPAKRQEQEKEKKKNQEHWSIISIPRKNKSSGVWVRGHQEEEEEEEEEEEW